MPSRKKKLAEQIIPYATSVEVEVGRGKTPEFTDEIEPPSGGEIITS